MLGRFTNHISPLSSYIHTSPSLVQAASASLKSSLGKLRKRTGYSLSTCKKALEETNHDLSKAEAWLKEQAQAHGWAKAQKLEGRNTQQGLLGVQIQGRKAALVQLNCETDFVARNSKFHSLLQAVSATCLAQPEEELASGVVRQTVVDRVAMGRLVTADQDTLADVVALSIGQVGENIVLGGATLMHTGEGVHLAGLTHPSASIHADAEKLQYGRYAALMAYSVPDTMEQSGVLARQVCQHIIGMAPTQVDNEEDMDNSLIHQDFLLDEEVKTGELLSGAGMVVHSFVRVEVGQNSSEE